MDTTKIKGITSCEGGRFNNLELSGLVNIKSDTVCENVTVSGVVNLASKLTAQSGIFKGVCNCNDLAISDLEINGVINGDNINSENIDLKGVLNISNDINTSNINSTGVIKVDGHLKAKNISIKIAAFNKINNINCDHLEVGLLEEKYDILSLNNVKKGPVYLEAKIIEGNNLNLVKTNADIVIGEHVVLKNNCKVTVLEYYESYQKDDTCEVLQIVKKTRNKQA